MAIFNIFDSHAHYDDEQFDPDRDSILSEIFKSGVCGIINASSDLPSCAASLLLSSKYKNVFAAVGIHPHSASSVSSDVPAQADYLKILEDLFTQNQKVVAIGEIGLDYHYDFSPRNTQLRVFEEQLLLANKLNAPVVIHSREATEDTMYLLKKHRPRGVVHCFSGSAETAKEVLKLGMYIGITGAVTFKNARKLIEVCGVAPLERILIETDCPYMAPVPYRGTRNDSRTLSAVAEKLAELYNVSAQYIADITRENVERLYGISID